MKRWMALAAGALVLLASGCTVQALDGQGAADAAGLSSARVAARTISEPTAPQTTEVAATSVTSSSSEPAALGVWISALMDRMAAGRTAVSSVHCVASVTVESTEYQGVEFDATYADGRPTAIRMTMALTPDENITLIEVDDEVYVETGTTLTDGYEGEWLLLTEDTGGSLGGYYPAFVDALAGAALDQYVGIAVLARDTTNRGYEDRDGVLLEKYKTTFDLTELDTATPSDSMKLVLEQLVSAGVESFTTEFWLDPDGRIVQLVDEYEVEGRTVITTTLYDHYNEELVITAPDPAVVTTP